MPNKNKVKLADLVSSNSAILRIHDGLREGYSVDGEKLITLINTCINFLHDVVTTAEAHKVSVDGKPVVPTTTQAIKEGTKDV